MLVRKCLLTFLAADHSTGAAVQGLVEETLTIMCASLQQLAQR